MSMYCLIKTPYTLKCPHISSPYWPMQLNAGNPCRKREVKPEAIQLYYLAGRFRTSNPTVIIQHTFPPKPTEIYCSLCFSSRRTNVRILHEQTDMKNTWVSIPEHFRDDAQACFTQSAIAYRNLLFTENNGSETKETDMNNEWQTIDSTVSGQ